MFTFLRRVRPDDRVKQRQHKALHEAGDEVEKRLEDHIAALVRDLDRLKREQDVLQTAKAAAEAASHSKSAFLASMSHDLRTPLHGILSFAGFGIKKAATATPEKLHSYFQKIDQSGRILLTLLDDLIDLAKLQSGRMPLEFKPVDPRKLLATVAEEFSAPAAERHLRIDTLAPDVATHVTLDPAKITRVIRNLMRTAVEVSPQGGTITLSLRQEERSIVVSVSDQGAGIPEEDLETIFDPVVASDKTNQGVGGSGPGLMMCGEMINLHMGRIWAENRPEGGSIFSFELPLHEPDAASTPEVVEVGDHMASSENRGVEPEPAEPCGQV